MRAVALLLTLLMVQGFVLARELRVPSEFATIQVAVDSCVNGDTVLIDNGVYAEAVEIVNRSITLRGESPPDSLTGQGAILDPTTLPGSQSMACLRIIDGGGVHLEQLWFKNGRDMHMGRQPDEPGGIDNANGCDFLRVSDCRFDSVYACVWEGKSVVLERVTMRFAQEWAIARGNDTRIDAEDCSFHGAAGSTLVSARSGSSFVRCSFTNLSSSWLLRASHDSILVSECEFGPFYSECGDAVWIRPGHGTVITNNVFQNISVGGAVLAINVPCSTAAAPAYSGALVRDNRFVNNYSGGCQGGYAIYLTCGDEQDSLFFAVLDSNRFESSSSRGFFANAVYTFSGGADLVDNRFMQLGPDACPTVLSYGLERPERLYLRNNAFDSLAFALDSQNDDTMVNDARLNWWGDSTGPFNAISNPSGQGAMVGDNVMFTPWLVQSPFHSDDTTNAASERAPLPEAFLLYAFPNPFNPTSTLIVTVPRAGEYSVTLYDITGREVRKLFNGTLAGPTEIALNGAALPSGVYFACLHSNSNHHATAKLLLLK